VKLNGLHPAMQNRNVSRNCTSIAGAVLLVAGVAWCDAPLRESFRAELSVHTPVNFVAGQIDGEMVFCVQGDALREGKRIAAVDVLDATGNRVRTITEPGPTGSSQSGAYLQWIEDKDGPLLLFSWVPDKDGVPGGANLVRIADGDVVARIENKTRFGNNNSIVADIDRDGTTDVLYADQQSLAFCALPSLEQRWRADTGINFCWSLPAFVDVTGDSRAEIVYGSEYNNLDGSSSFIALDAQGNNVWRTDGYAEDLGSTPVFVADVDGDGVNELIKVGLDLEHRKKQEWNHVHVFDARGQLKSRIAFGCTGIALANLDGDAALEGVGITNTRDGGNNGIHAIRCVDLGSGKVEWETPVARAYLDDNSPVVADINGDGKLEVVVGTGNPWGYARFKDSAPWGEQYVVSARGEIVQRVTLPGRPTNSAIVDIDGDGSGELITVLDGQPGWLAVYKTSAQTMRRTWHTPFGSAMRDGTMRK